MPFYLTGDPADALKSAIRDFQRSPTNAKYFIQSNKRTEFSDVMLQGDIWKNFPIYDFSSDNRRNDISGIVVSNSCDVSRENKREIPAKISFCPLVPLSKIETLLAKEVDKKSVESKIESIKRQQTTQFFYLPAQEPLNVDCVINLSDIHSIDAGYYCKSASSSKFLTLSQFGFYLLTFKLSVHFCRQHENVQR
ncbi:hypothetical protein [Asticcacaulis sp.]|uniref:hypothetical protein n=1 Tax=Asticcacaulis sp. TaxID=1872648 RepID=UPI0031E24749